MIPVDKGIPIPSRGKHVIYPWTEMEIGDSFFVAIKDGETKRAVCRRVSPAAGKDAQRTGRKYTVRVVEGGLRVWRIK